MVRGSGDGAAHGDCHAFLWALIGRRNAIGSSEDKQPIRRALVMMPGNLGDAVAATAFLAAFREACPQAHVTALTKRKLRPVLYGVDSVDRVLSVRRRRRRTSHDPKRGDRVSLVRLGRRLSRGGFDTAILLPNSFRAAALASVAGIPRRIGYEHEGRGVLLTDRLVRRRHRGSLIRVPVIDQYLGIARYLGANPSMPKLQQFVSPAAEQRAAFLLDEHGLDPSQRLLLIDSRLLTQGSDSLVESMNKLCSQSRDRLELQPTIVHEPLGARIATSIPKDLFPTTTRIDDLGAGLSGYKAVLSRAGLLLTDDPALHLLAAALEVPTLSSQAVSGAHTPDAGEFIEHAQRLSAGVSAVGIGG